MNIQAASEAFTAAAALAQSGQPAERIRAVIGKEIPLLMIHKLVRLARNEARQKAAEEKLAAEARRREDAASIAFLRSRYRIITVSTAGEPPPMRIADLIEQACATLNISKVQFLSPCRNHRVAHERQRVMYEAALHTKHSYPSIGRIMGGRDHTTVMYGVRAHAERNGLPLPRGMQPRGDA